MKTLSAGIFQENSHCFFIIIISIIWLYFYDICNYCSTWFALAKIRVLLHILLENAFPTLIGSKQVGVG